MKLTKSEIGWLGLKPNQVRLINLLATSPFGLALPDLVQKLTLPRSTISSELHVLKKRDLVTAKKHGRNNHWFSLLDKTPLRRSVNFDPEGFSEVRVYEGVEDIKDLYCRILALHHHERVIIIEGKRAVSAIAEKAGVNFIEAWHTVAYERQLIIESLVSEETIRKLKVGEINAEIIKSLQRFKLWIGFVVPDNVINTNSALLLFRDSVILVDWNKDRGVLVENREMVALLRHMIEVYKSQSRQVNLIKLVHQV